MRLAVGDAVVFFNGELSRDNSETDFFNFLFFLSCLLS